MPLIFPFVLIGVIFWVDADRLSKRKKQSLAKSTKEILTLKE